MKTAWLAIGVLILGPAPAIAQLDAAPDPRPDVMDPTTRPPSQAEQADVHEPWERIPLGTAVDGTAIAMSLTDLEGLALANHPSLARGAARVAAARGQWLQAGLPPNPVAGYSASEMGNDGAAGQQGGFIGQEFVTGGKLRLNRAVASQDVAIAEQQLEAQRFRVLTDVRVGFYDVLASQRRVEIAERLVSIGERGVEGANRLLEREEGSRIELLQARVEASSAKMVLANARNDYSAAWRRFAAVVAVADMQPVPLEGDLSALLDEIGFDNAMQRLLQASPEIAAARATVLRARRAVDRARAEPIPNMDVQALIQHDNSTGSDIAGVQVGLPLPLRNRNQGAIRRAEAELAAARSDVGRVELALRHRLATAYQRYANSRQEAMIYAEEVLPDAQSSLDLATTGYTAGEFSYLTLLTAQRTYFQANLSYVNALRALRQSEAEIEGLVLADSLQGE